VLPTAVERDFAAAAHDADVLSGVVGEEVARARSNFEELRSGAELFPLRENLSG